LIPKFLRNWFSTTPQGGFFGTPSHTILWLLRGVFLALSIGIATSALVHFDSSLLAGLAMFSLVMLISMGVVAADLLAKNKQITACSWAFCWRTCSGGRSTRS
jgi:hypothetical protein